MDGVELAGWKYISRSTYIQYLPGIPGMGTAVIMRERAVLEMIRRACPKKICILAEIEKINEVYSENRSTY